MFENNLINAITIVALFWLGSYVITMFIGLVGKATSKTKTTLDDDIIKSVKLPIRYAAILLGLFFASKNFEFSWEWKEKTYGFPDIFFVLLILLAAFTISRTVKVAFEWYGNTEQGSKTNQTMFVFSRKMSSVLIYLIATIIILGQFNVQIGPLLAGLGVAGLAIALGLKTTLENLFSALFLVADKSINIGDWIQLQDGTKAYIEDISWRSVRIRTIGGNTVIVPNAVFVGQQISSYDYPVSSFFTSITLGVSYDTDLEKAEYVAMQAAEKVIKEEKINEQDNNPSIRYTLFGNSAIEFKVIIKIGAVTDEGRIQHALIKEIHKQFKENKIEIPFPQMVVHKG